MSSTATVPPSSQIPEPPGPINGATVHGRGGVRRLRHPGELPLLRACVAITTLAAVAWLALVVWTELGPEPTGTVRTLRTAVLGNGPLARAELLLVVPLPAPGVWVVRAYLYARMRASAVQMSPTQFPEGYRMVVEAARRFGLRRVPDAYVLLGNGRINAFAAGHGYRRFVAVYSDLFEVGGTARDPEALRFVIGHEVGHIAAGHVSFWRTLVLQVVMYVPVLGTTLSRAQEYTADNHGYDVALGGAPGVVGLLGAGKYLGPTSICTRRRTALPTRRASGCTPCSGPRPIDAHVAGPRAARPERPGASGTAADDGAVSAGRAGGVGPQWRVAASRGDAGPPGRRCGARRRARDSRRGQRGGAVRPLPGHGPRCGTRRGASGRSDASRARGYGDADALAGLAEWAAGSGSATPFTEIGRYSRRDRAK